MDRLKSIFRSLLELVKMITLYWACIIWPILYALSVVSNRYWGNDNDFEQVVEAIHKLETGQNVDISKELNGYPEPFDLKKYIPNER